MTITRPTSLAKWLTITLLLGALTAPANWASEVSVRSAAPAGVAKNATGHHHLIIDAPLPDSSLPIPNDATHRHFGGGQTEASIELAPGKHTLQLILGDAVHVPHAPLVASKQISITVK